MGGNQVTEYTAPVPHREGPAVDASGVTPQGDSFSGIAEYKRLLLQLLLQQEVDEVARHLVSSVLVYGTGAEIEFADRDAVEEIVARGRDRGHPIRTMIHEVVQSELFRNRQRLYETRSYDTQSDRHDLQQAEDGQRRHLPFAFERSAETAAAREANPGKQGRQYAE